MENKFDPYRKWLGIAPKDQPPNKYRLLGIDLYEHDADVISNAADQRMSHVRTFQAGKHSQLSQRILGELSNAKLTLLNEEKKQAYDAQLKAELSPSAPPHAAPPRSSAHGATNEGVEVFPGVVDKAPDRRVPALSAIGKATHTSVPHPTRPSVATDSARAPAARVAGAPVIRAETGIGSSPATASRVRRKKSNTPIFISAGLLVFMLVVGVVLFSLFSGGSASKPNGTTTNGNNTNGGGQDVGLGNTPLAVTPGTGNGPSISKIATQEVTPSAELKLIVRADGDKLRFSLDEAPPGARIDSNSGELRWRPLGLKPGFAHYITVKVRDAKGDAETTRFQVKVIEEALTTGSGLRAEFFSDKELQSKVASRIDPNIDFLWYQSSPEKDVPKDSFSARWTGTLTVPRPGQYALAAFVDDGVRLWIDDRKVLDKWYPGTARMVRENIYLSDGPHRLKVEYFDTYADATMQLRWIRPDGVDEIIPASAFNLDLDNPSEEIVEQPGPGDRPKNGLQAAVYRGTEFDEEVKSWIETDLDWRWTSGFDQRRLVSGPFGIELSGGLSAPDEGKYKLRFDFTGELEVELDSQQIIRQGNDPDERGRAEVEVRLSEKPQPFTIRLATGSGEGRLTVRWLRPGSNDRESLYELIPYDFLSPAEMVAVQPTPTPPVGPPLTEDQRRTRMLVEGILRIGGQVTLVGDEEPILTLESLPPGAFEVEAVALSNDQVGNNHLKALVLFPNLKKLKLTSQAITDEGMRELLAMKELVELELHLPQVTEAGYRELLAMPQLGKLYVESEKISDRLFVTLKRLPQLQSLVIDSDQITGDELNALRDMPTLKELMIISGGLRDANLKGLRALETLDYLVLFAPISSEGLANLSGVKARRVAITSNAIDDGDFVHFQNLPNLVALHLKSLRSPIGDEGCAHLTNCRRLETLSLLNAQDVTANGLARLLRSPSLQSVRLVGADISEDDLKQLRDGTKIEIIIE